jgi:hypothetical protein
VPTDSASEALALREQVAALERRLEAIAVFSDQEARKGQAPRTTLAAVAVHASGYRTPQLRWQQKRFTDAEVSKSALSRVCATLKHITNDTNN